MSNIDLFVVVFNTFNATLKSVTDFFKTQSIKKNDQTHSVTALDMSKISNKIDLVFLYNQILTFLPS